MSGDLVRARSASVADALGDDFWAWWRTAMVAGLLAMLAALLAMGTLAPSDTTWYLEALLFTVAWLLGTCATVVAYVAALRCQRWGSVHRERRLPVTKVRQRWDAVGYLVMATVVWVALALWSVAAAAYPNRNGVSTASPWIVAVLVAASTAGLVAKAGQSLSSQALSAALMVTIYLGLGPLLREWQNIPGSALSAAAIAAIGLLLWSFWQQPNASRVKVAGRTWASLWKDRAAAPRSAWSAWAAHYSSAFFTMAPMVAMSSTHLAKIYIEGQSQPSPIMLWLGYQLSVFFILAFMWQTPEHHWRVRLSPLAARQRSRLALRLWSAQCMRALPLLAVPPLLTSPWMLSWPYAVSETQAMLHAVRALPWLIANGALLLAAVTLWVGVRRAQLRWDWLLLAGWPVVMWRGMETIGAEEAHRLSWAGRWDVLAGLVAATAVLLALGCWAWSRGSLTGMERWGATGRYAQR